MKRIQNVLLLSIMLLLSMIFVLNSNDQSTVERQSGTTVFSFSKSVNFGNYTNEHIKFQKK